MKIKIKIKDNVEGYWYKAGETYEVEESDFDNWYCYNKGYISTSHADIVIFVDTPGTTSWTGPDGTVFKYPTDSPITWFADPFPEQKPVESVVTFSSCEKFVTPTDNINPSHYRSHPSGVECIQVTEHYNFNIGNAIKYLWRNGLKKEEGLSEQQKQIEDLKKAIWYIQREISKLDPNDLP